MARACYEASAPGSLMLLGEHAVLRGKTALACAVDKRIRVRLTPVDGPDVRLASALGVYASCLHELPDDHAFRFVLAAVRRWRDRLPSGFRLQIDSEFSHTVGWGSSAAVTVAVLAVLRRWLDDPFDRMDLVREGRALVQHVQGRGSGTDVAASVFGGVIAFHPAPLRVVSLAAFLPICVVYSGHKVPTMEVIRKVAETRERDPGRIDRIFEAMGRDAEEAADLIREGAWRAVGDILNRSHDRMRELGVSTPLLDDIAEALRARPGIVGAKISGSGLGDCVVGLGEDDGAELPGERLEAAVTGQGVTND